MMPYNISPKSISLVGQKFSRLSVVGVATIKRNRAYRCVCDCGTEKIIRHSELTNSRTQSCGCLQQELRRMGKKRIR